MLNLNNIRIGNIHEDIARLIKRGFNLMIQIPDNFFEAFETLEQQIDSIEDNLKQMKDNYFKYFEFQIMIEGKLYEDIFVAKDQLGFTESEVLEVNQIIKEMYGDHNENGFIRYRLWNNLQETQNLGYTYLDVDYIISTRDKIRFKNHSDVSLALIQSDYENNPKAAVYEKINEFYPIRKKDKVYLKKNKLINKNKVI